MEIVADLEEVREYLDAARMRAARIGFVPTMGYLHEGHASLMRAARASCDVLVVSIFVNPLQFAAGEDLDRYPRDEARDEAICETEGADLVFRPSVEAMYGDGTGFTIDVGHIGTVLEGASRPGHFNGVATVVAKLFNIIGPCRAYFGEKDAQQLVVIRRLVESFDMPVEIVACPTVREPDGLAMSSRNAYLDEADRAAAVVLPAALSDARDRIVAGETDAAGIATRIAGRISAEPRADLDHIAVVDPRTLMALTRIERTALIVAAVRFGSTRLIDNVSIS